eukprot:3643040-Pleurochrysis_carterae.AAC.1
MQACVCPRDDVDSRACRSMSSYASLSSGLSMAATTGRHFSSPSSSIRKRGFPCSFIDLRPSRIA